MKREIKFRAKRVNGSEWEYGHYAYFCQYPDSESKHIMLPNGWQIDENTLGQFTGLYDKNSKEIYEGDICRVLYTDWPSKINSDSRSLQQYLIDISSTLVCVYDFSGFCFSSSIEGYMETMQVGKHGFIEVIGNIYENPELL